MKVLLHTTVTLLFLLSNICFGQNGPEYLEQEDLESDSPLVTGFSAYYRPLFEGRQLNLGFRSYYRQVSAEGKVDAEDLAGGVRAKFRYDFFDGQLQFGSTLFGVGKIYAEKNNGDTGLLKPGHHSYNGMSELYVNFTADKLTLKAGRFSLNAPYLNRSDSRMEERTFQGALGSYRYSDSLTFLLGVFNISARGVGQS